MMDTMQVMHTQVWKCHSKTHNVYNYEYESLYSKTTENSLYYFTTLMFKLSFKVVYKVMSL